MLGDLYLVLMGILDCWIGVVVCTIAMLCKGKGIYWGGIIAQTFLLFMTMFNGSSSNLSILSSVIFFSLFFACTYYVMKGKWDKTDKEDCYISNESCEPDDPPYTFYVGMALIFIPLFAGIAIYCFFNM